ncbi:MAG: hypothetical protein PUI85_04745 [Eubacteriales bacterium]|nr:hypothetical protein [Eubacteriales bacterium]MDY3332167.1 hypothetical protein [Gallibacter sp.]
MKNKIFWTLEQREDLSFFLKEGYSVNQIAKIYKETEVRKTVSVPFLLKEIKKGLTEDEYENARYVKYRPLRALVHDYQNLFGEETFSKLCVYLKDKNWKDIISGEGI